MKKILALVLALICVTALFACGSKDNDTEKETKAPVATTEAPTEAPTEPQTEAPTEPQAEIPTDITFEDGVYSVGSFKMTAPENFILTENNGIDLLVPSNYPEETDNINVQVSLPDNDENFDEEAFKAQLEQIYGTISDFQTEIGEVDGVTTRVITYPIEINGIKMELAQLLIYAEDASYVVTFTNVTRNYEDAFIDSINSISIDK